MKYFKILLSLIVLMASKPSIQAQKFDAKNFEFEYKWGIYEHNKVNSKEGKVYVRIDDYERYADTTINFTNRDKKRIWNKLIKINFFDYPEFYSPKPPKQDTVPEFIIIEGIDNKAINIPPDTFYIQPLPGKDTIPEIHITEGIYLDSFYIAPDTFYLPPKYHNYIINTITPHRSFSLTVLRNNYSKKVIWDEQNLTEYINGQDIDVYDPKHDQLLKLGEFIERMTRKKKGFKNLPESNLEYY